MKRSAPRAISWLAVALLGATATHAKGPTAHADRSDARTARAAATAPGEAERRNEVAVAPPRAPEHSPSTPAEPPPSDLTERARQLYLLGAEAFAAQRNADAISYFRQAQRLVPSAKLTYNIALAYAEMGDTGHALSAYRAFLALEPDSVHREEVQARVAQYELSLAALGLQQLSISSDPPGASVRVGEEIVGVTPWVGELTPGLHQVRLERSGYRPQQAEVVLAAQHAGELYLKLAVQPAEAPEPPGALARIQPLSWAFLGIGVASVGGGIGFELSRAASSDRAGRATAPASVARAEGAADAKQMASLLLLGAGGAFLVGGGVLLVLDLQREPGSAGAPSMAQWGLPCGAEFCGVMTQGRF